MNMDLTAGLDVPLKFKLLGGQQTLEKKYWFLI